MSKHHRGWLVLSVFALVTFASQTQGNASNRHQASMEIISTRASSFLHAKLNDAERAAIKSTTTGQWISCKPAPEGLCDSDKHPLEQDTACHLSAKFVQFLLEDSEVQRLVGTNGIRFCGVSIDGNLDLVDSNTAYPIQLRSSSIAQGINLQRAILKSLDLSNSELGPIQAGYAIVQGDILLNDCIATGINLYGAKITGDVYATNAQLKQPPEDGPPGLRGRAFTAERVHIDGDVFLDYSSAFGEVLFDDARVKGYLSISDASLENPGGVAFTANAAHVGGWLLLDRTSATGTLNLDRSEIGGGVGAVGACFRSRVQPAFSAFSSTLGLSVELTPSTVSKSTSAKTLAVCSAQTGNAVPTPSSKACSDGSSVQPAEQPFTVFGRLDFSGAHIGTDFNAPGAIFHNQGDVALTLFKAQIGRSVLLNSNAKVEGIIDLRQIGVSDNLDLSFGYFEAQQSERFGNVEILATGARIDGVANLENLETNGEVIFDDSKIEVLSLKSARFDDLGLDDTHAPPIGLSAHRALIKQSLIWRKVLLGHHTVLDLADAGIGRLAIDDVSSWPSFGNLVVNGMTETGEPKQWAPNELQAKLRWLRHQSSSEPYEALAKLMKDSGREDDAVEVLIAKEDAADVDRSWVWRFFDKLFRMSMGYGYSPLELLWPAIILVAFGSVLTSLAYRARIIVPVDKDAYYVFRSNGLAPRYYPRFNSGLFSCETFIPLINLNQVSNWHVNTLLTSKRPVVLFRGLKKVRYKFGRRFGSIVALYLWIETLSGWVIATLLVAAFSELIRKT
jgi:hypothetical protein